jgi:hypothetical protein
MLQSDNPEQMSANGVVGKKIRWALAFTGSSPIVRTMFCDFSLCARLVPSGLRRR